MTLVVPLAAGTGLDTIARLYSEKLSENLGRPVLIENRPGANMVPPTQSVIAAPADGHTLLVATPTQLSTNQTLYKKLQYSPEKNLRAEGKYQWPMWTHIFHSVKTPARAPKLATGADSFAFLENDPEVAAVFNRAMAELTRLVSTEVVRVFNFSAARRIVDVGGGYGTMLATILESYPDLRGVLFDLQHAIEGARINLTHAGLIDRCELVAGDFFKSIPRGADTYLLKAVVHDWDDERGCKILRNCRTSMPHGATLLLIERILPRHFRAGARHNSIAKVDLSMLVEQGGRERSEAEFRELLNNSGFAIARIHSTEMDYSIIECLPL